MTPTALAGRLVTGLLDLLFPPCCVGCGREGPYLCPACLETTPRLASSIPGEGLDGIAAPFAMEGPARQAVHRLKYNGLRALAPAMGALLAGYLRSTTSGATSSSPHPCTPASSGSEATTRPICWTSPWTGWPCAASSTVGPRPVRPIERSGKPWWPAPLRRSAAFRAFTCWFWTT